MDVPLTHEGLEWAHGSAVTATEEPIGNGASAQGPPAPGGNAVDHARLRLRCCGTASRGGRRGWDNCRRIQNLLTTYSDRAARAIKKARSVGTLRALGELFSILVCGRLEGLFQE